MDLTPLFRLPPEILDGILALIDGHEDILSFALANRECSKFAIPRHTEYRILRIRHSYPSVWAHLAQRADLASFITHVHITDKNTRLFPERVPSSLVPPSDGTPESLDEAVRIRNICKAIYNMKSLRSFVWEFHSRFPQRPTVLPEHEDAILRVLQRRKTLDYFALIGPFGSHAPTLTHDPDSKHYPLWRFGKLRCLNLLGDAWVRPPVTPHVLRLLASMPLLEHLELPLEFSHLHRLNFPSLKTLRLQLLTGASASLDLTRSQFIERHTTLQSLCWFPLALPSLSSEALPNLRYLSTTRHVVECLTSVAPPPPTPSSFSFAVFQNLPPITEDPRETNALPTPSGSIRRPIECLDVRSLDARSLLDFHEYFLDSNKLRRLKLHTFYDVSDVCQVGDTFPEITWLWLPNAHLPSGSAHPKPIELEDLYSIVSHFPRLEVLRGQAVWSAVGNNLDQMHLAIFQLATRAPCLRQLDHSGFDDHRQAYKRIAIQRDIVTQDGVDAEHLTYRVVKPKPRDTWDIFDGAFE